MVFFFQGFEHIVPTCSLEIRNHSVAKSRIKMPPRYDTHEEKHHGSGNGQGGTSGDTGTAVAARGASGRARSGSAWVTLALDAEIGPRRCREAAPLISLDLTYLGRLRWAKSRKSRSTQSTEVTGTVYRELLLERTTSITTRAIPITRTFSLNDSNTAL